MYWRPTSTVPNPPRRPTKACRPNSSPPCPAAPVSPWKPFSSTNNADIPLPRSSVPLNPRREPALTPLVTLVTAPAVPPLSRMIAISIIPYAVMPLWALATGRPVAANAQIKAMRDARACVFICLLIRTDGSAACAFTSYEASLRAPAARKPPSTARSPPCRVPGLVAHEIHHGRCNFGGRPVAVHGDCMRVLLAELVRVEGARHLCRLFLHINAKLPVSF